MQPNNSWSDNLALWNAIKGKLSTGKIRQLPSLLISGASPLELARQTQAPLSVVNDVLTNLSGNGIVESQSSSTSATPEVTRIYHLTSDGVRFFQQFLNSTSE